MRYMLLLYHDDQLFPKPGTAEEGQLYQGYARFHEEVQKIGATGGSERLRPPSDATTVRVRKGKRVTTDGPFAETKEQLAGYYLLDCKDLDEALELAAILPSAQYGSVEVRPIFEM